MNLAAHVETHPGYVRDNNEDAHLALPDRGLMAVADGMAGHRFGELASAMTVKTIRRFFESDELDRLLSDQFRRAIRAGLESEELPYEEFKLRRAIEEANQAVFNAASLNPQYESMGTTVVAALLCEETVHLAHIGDSRIYLMREETLDQVTTDHSLFNEYLKRDYITPDEASTFPMKNVIVRALGVREQVEVECGRLPVQPGDTLMLCTDGLTDLVSDGDIAPVLAEKNSPEIQVRKLIELALEAGGVDNVTVAVLQL